jgi:hypothetical protein
MDDMWQELSDLIEDAGLVLYMTPPPHRQHIVGCTYTWPNGYPGSAKLNPQCKAHAWVRPAQAQKKAVLTLPVERWEDDGGKGT